MTIPASFLDQLRDRITLSTLIGKSLALKKAGREFRGCCPFHDEKTPSFYVNDQKGFYHCFGCAAHGDAIRWMVDYLKMDFQNAVRDLAEGAGLAVPSSDPRDEQRRRDHALMLDVMARAERWFAAQRRGAAALESGAEAYLAKRDLLGQTAEDFMLGWAPAQPRDALPNMTNALRDIEREVLETVGLTMLREAKSIDFFRNRIMIPIHDPRGRCIGFGGRVINQANPKYLNSPDTPIFNKGRTLFNEHRAAACARRSDRLVISEGYMDVMAFWRAGVGECVAPNGTALTEHQIARAWRLAPEPILALDGDKAGRAAAVRAAKTALPILEPGKSLRFVSLPAGQDPDDILRDHGREALTSMLSKPEALHDLLWRAEVEAAGDLNSPERQAGFGNTIRQLVDSIRSPEVRASYERTFAERFRRHFQSRSARPAGSTSIDAPARQPRKEVPRSDASTKVGRGALGNSLEMAVIKGLLRFPERVLEQTGQDLFANPDLALIYDAIQRAVYIEGYRDPAADMLVEDLSRKGINGLERIMTLHGLPMSFARDPVGPTAEEDLSAALHSLASRKKKERR